MLNNRNVILLVDGSSILSKMHCDVKNSGSIGCVVNSRCSEIDPFLKILDRTYRIGKEQNIDNLQSCTIRKGKSSGR